MSKGRSYSTLGRGKISLVEVKDVNCWPFVLLAFKLENSTDKATLMEHVPVSSTTPPMLVSTSDIRRYVLES